MPSQRESRGTRAPTGGGVRPRWALQWIVGVAIVAYLLVFFLAPIPEIGNRSRVSLLGSELLLAEESVARWFGDPPQFAIVDRLRVAVPAAALLAESGLVGWLLLRLFRADRGLAALETVFFSTCVGLSAVSLYTLAVGLAGGLGERWLFWAPAAIVTSLGVQQLWWQYTSPAAQPRAKQPDDRADNAPQMSRRWLWWAAPFAAAIVLGGTLPPLDFDVREYHLQAPKEFYQAGRIGFLPHNVYANMPLGSEMLSLAAMVTLGDWWPGALVGKTVIAACAPLAALGLWTAGRRFFDQRAGTVAALVYISIPWITEVSTAGLIEGVSALYLWGTVYAVLPYLSAAAKQQLPSAALAGFLAGSAAACKYPNVLFVLVPAALVLGLRAWRASDSHAAPAHRSLRWRPLAGFLLAAIVACGPWFAKNWVLTGNPTYPLLYGMFDGQSRTPELDAQWRQAHRSPGFAPQELLSSLANVGWRSLWQSPLLLPLAALGVWGAGQRRRLAWGLALYALAVFALWWAFTHRIDRFWVPVLPVLAFLAGMAADRDALVAWRPLLKIFLGAGLAVNLFLILAGAGGDTGYFVSLAQLQADPARHDPWHLYLNAHLPADETLLAVGDGAVFDLAMPVIYSTVFDENPLETLLKRGTAEERRRALAKRNIRHVFVHWGEIARYRSPGNYGFSGFIRPELFDELVRERVLAAPQMPLESPAGQLYRVEPASTAD